MYYRVLQFTFIDNVRKLTFEVCHDQACIVFWFCFTASWIGSTFTLCMSLNFDAKGL